VERIPTRLRRCPSLVVRRDGTVAQAFVNWEEDSRIQAAMETHNVVIELSVEPMEGYLKKKPGRMSDRQVEMAGTQRARRTFDETSAFGKSAVLCAPIFIIGVLYILSQVKARLQGDAEDRRKLNVSKDETKKVWREQERIGQLKREAETMAKQGYELDDICKRLDRLGVPYEQEEIDDLVLLAKEGKLGPAGSSLDGEDDEEGGEAVVFRNRQGDEGDGSSMDETQRFLKSAVKVQRAQDAHQQKIQQARLRKVGRKMQQRGVKFQYLDDETVTFKDVAGLPEIVYQLQEVVDFFKNPQQWRKVGARVPKGILLEGPPGNGKTLMARAVAGESGVSFLSINASEFVEMFIGVGAARVRDVFATARQLAPAIVFIDELDAVGRKRGGAEGNEERDQTVNQLLSEIDGFEESTNIVIMAATNRADILDEALVRPGRFDRKIRVDQPELEARKSIFLVHANRRPMDEDVDADDIAKLTSGMSGAEIADVVNQGSLIAAREGAEELHHHHFLAALKRGQLGDRIDHYFDPSDKERLAKQSAAIGLAMTLLPALEDVEVLSIAAYERLPLGRQNVIPNDSRRRTNQWTREYYQELLVATIAGFAAEQLEHPGRDALASTINQSHLHLSRHIAAQLVMVLGATGDKDLPETFLPPFAEQVSKQADIWSFGPHFKIPQSRFTQKTLEKAEKYRQDLLDRALERAKKLIGDNQEAFEAVSTELTRTETMEGDRLREIVRQYSKDYAQLL